MKWSWHDLMIHNGPLSIDRQLNLAKQLIRRDPHEILSASPFQVNASLNYQFQRVNVKAKLTGTLTVPSSRSLVPVRLPLNFKFCEVYVTSESALRRYEQNHPHGYTVLTVDSNGMIDFTQALIDNIILQIPMKILSPREKRDHLMPKGHGWRVISEAEYRHPKSESDHVDPRLAKLKDYFKK